MKKAKKKPVQKSTKKYHERMENLAKSRQGYAEIMAECSELTARFGLQINWCRLTDGKEPATPIRFALVPIDPLVERLETLEKLMELAKAPEGGGETDTDSPATCELCGLDSKPWRYWDKIEERWAIICNSCREAHLMRFTNEMSFDPQEGADQ